MVTISQHVEDLIKVAPLYLNAPIEITAVEERYTMFRTSATLAAIRLFGRYVQSVGSPVIVADYSCDGRFALIHGVVPRV